MSDGKQLMRLVADLDILWKEYKKKVDSLCDNVEVISKSIPGAQSRQNSSQIEGNASLLKLPREESKEVCKIKSMQEILPVVESLKQSEEIKKVTHVLKGIQEQTKKVEIPQKSSGGRRSGCVDYNNI